MFGVCLSNLALQGKPLRLWHVLALEFTTVIRIVSLPSKKLLLVLPSHFAVFVIRITYTLDFAWLSLLDKHYTTGRINQVAKSVVDLLYFHRQTEPPRKESL